MTLLFGAILHGIGAGQLDISFKFSYVVTGLCLHVKNMPNTSSGKDQIVSSEYTG